MSSRVIERRSKLNLHVVMWHSSHGTPLAQQLNVQVMILLVEIIGFVFFSRTRLLLPLGNLSYILVMARLRYL